MEDLTPILPAHIEETIQSIARLHAEHHQTATRLQRMVDRMTGLVGQPPFVWLDGLVGLGALYIALLILITRRRADQLAQHREQRTLELAILNEQKTAKVIELLEEMRRDTPNLCDRVDHEAAAMAVPADPQAVLDAIRISHAEAELLGGPAPVEAEVQALNA